MSSPRDEGARTAHRIAPPRRPMPVAGDPLGPATVVIQLVVLAACAGLSAILETVLVPYRVGTVIVPVAIAGALASNSVLPVLAWRTRRAIPAAALPFGIWVITVLFLSQSRPEGDVLLPGGKSGVTYVSYGLLVAGFVTGLATLVWLGNRGAALRSTSVARRR